MAESASGVALEVAEVALLEAYIDGKGGLGRHMHGSKRACNEIPARRRGEKGDIGPPPPQAPTHWLLRAPLGHLLRSRPQN